MKKIALNLFALTVAATFSIGCATESANEEESSLNSTANVFAGQDIQQAQLTGTWQIESMISDVAVDLNSDGTANVDMLEETTCFDSLFFNFNDKGVIEAHQARLNFVDGEMQCNGEGDYTATYTVSGNELSVNFQSGDSMITLTKTIGLSNDATGEYLHVAIEDHEAGELVEDPGNTSVSEIQRIEMTFKKQ